MKLEGVKYFLHLSGASFEILLKVSYDILDD